jgi:hypothetical protein
MPLPKTKSLVIACQSIAPFVDVPLLRRRPDNSLEALPNAPNVPVDKVLKRLATLDDEYDLHTIPSILDFLHRKCWDAGYSLGMGTKQLLDDKQIGTIDDLSDEVSGRTTKA